MGRVLEHNTVRWVFDRAYYPHLRIDMIRITYFSETQKSSILGGRMAPGAPEPTPKGWALRAPPFGVVSRGPRGRPDPQIDDFWVPQKFRS